MPLQLESATALFTLCYNAAHRNYFTNLQMGGHGSPPALPAQRASTSESCACTSMVSCGNPGTCRVKRAWERSWTMVSESDCRSSKVRGCSSSIMDPYSCDHLRGSASSPISPCSYKLVGSSSSHSSTSSCSSPSGSSSSSCVCLSSSSEGESIVSPAQETAGPKLHNAVCLLGNVWHKIWQCDSCPLLCPAEVIGDPMGGDPLRLVPGGIIHQDACFKDEAPHHT